MMRRVLDDDDRVIDDDADREHQAEQREHIDAEPEQPHGEKRADDRHGHGRRGNEQCPPILQEDQNDKQHQDAGFDERFINGVNRFVDEFRGIQRKFVAHSLGKRLREFRDRLADFADHVQRVAARQLEDADVGGRLSFDEVVLIVRLAAELDRGRCLSAA